MAILETKLTARKTVFWRDQDGKEYGRVCIGMVWPGAKPGYAVVLAEQEFSRDKLHYYVLTEMEELNLSEFIRSLYELTGLYNVTDIYGDPAEEVAAEFLRQFNDELRERRQDGLHIIPPPMLNSPSCFEYSVQTIKKHGAADRRTLHIGEKSRLVSALLELHPRDLQTATAKEYPAIAALGYSLTPLDTWPAVDPEARCNDRQETDYDPFDLDYGYRPAGNPNQVNIQQNDYDVFGRR